jgi:hypothetical protein
MDGMIRYYIVTKYKGISKKNPQNTHLFFIPVDPKKYMYLALIGKMDEEEEGSDNVYAAQLLVKIHDEVIDEIINGEIDYFKDRFIEVESLKCKSSNPSPGKYIITVQKKGFNIQSNVELDYQIEYSTAQRRIYTLKADLNLITGDVNEKDMKMVAAKQMAFMGGLERFNEMEHII